ncbi:MAG: hypothetical protein AB1714_05905 [Acidobacteriota bacterium]
MTENSRAGIHMDCSEQREIDSELCILSRASVQPRLSLQFSHRLRARLALEKQSQRRSRRRLLVMQIYWLVAAVASIAVVLLIRWPHTLPPATSVYLVGALLMAILISPLLLLLHHRIGLMQLVISTACVKFARDNEKMEV